MALTEEKHTLQLTIHTRLKRYTKKTDGKKVKSE